MLRSKLILGYATNAGAAAIHPFVASARRWHPADQCRIALFVTPGVDAAAVQALADQHDIELVPATSQWSSAPRSRIGKLAARGALAWWRFWDLRQPASNDLSRQLALAAWFHPHYARWFDYWRYLQLMPNIEHVFLSDVNDVIFQNDVFDSIAPTGLTLAALPLVFDGRNVDSQWLRDALGERRLAQLIGKPALCIGTVGGRIDAATDLCRRMWQTFDASPYGGVEQAYFNDLYYRGAFDGSVVMTNQDRFVLTITSPAECPKLEAVDGGLREGDVTPAVVHMYNRLPANWAPHIEAIIHGHGPSPLPVSR